MRRILRALLLLVYALLILSLGAWGTLALWYRLPFGPEVRTGAAIAWALLMLGLLVALFIAPRNRVMGSFVIAVSMLLGWWSTLQPSNARDWAPDVARTVRGEINGDILVLTDVRNFDWQTQADFTPRWEVRTYDLSQLVSMDLIADYWDGEAIAHTMVSFGFSDGRYLVWSVEMRRRRSDVFSAIAGFFKQAELAILAGDERDMVRLRTNIRPEDLRVYRLTTGPVVAREALLAYVAEANDLADKPRWYNTATTNCTTVVFKIAKAVEPGVPLDWRVMVSGYFPDYAYDHGALDQSLPFPELRERAKLSARAKAADTEPSAEFSKAIRAGVPGIAP